MFNRINILKNKGYKPDIILDIGAYKGDWTNECLKIYNNCKYFLFEAIEYNELNKFDLYDNIEYFYSLLSDEVKIVDWYQKKNTGDSIFKEKTFHFNDCEILKKETITLDYYFNDEKLKDINNIFIKIDCQGSEIPILKGAKKLYNKIDFIILEMPFFGEYNEGVPSFLEYIKFMDNIGFIPFDFLENHYINNFDMQVDIMFINKNHEFNKTVQKLLL